MNIVCGTAFRHRANRLFFSAVVHKKVHAMPIYVPLGRLCPFCDKKMQFGHGFGKIIFILLIYAHRQHLAADISPRDVSQKGTDTSPRTVRTPLSCHSSFLPHPCGISSSARTPLPPNIPFGELLLQKPLLIHPLPLRLYAVIADYSFAAADRSLTHLQQHFRISQIISSAGLRRFKLHIKMGEAPLAGSFLFHVFIYFLTHSAFYNPSAGTSRYIAINETTETAEPIMN